MNTIAELNKIPKSEWPAIWCSLNSWKIHDQIKHLQPDWWPETLNIENVSAVKSFIKPIMEHIQNYISDEVLSREWNKDNMTDEQHKKWYHLPDEEKFIYYEPNDNNSIP